MDSTKIIEKEFTRITKSVLVHEAVLLVENESGDFRSERGYGGKDVYSPILMASVAKLFVTACLLIFKKQRKLYLNDKLSGYFEDGVLNGLHTFKGKDYSHNLTLADLLFHKSGLPCWYQTGGVHQRVINEDFEFSFEKQLENTRNREAEFAPSGRKAYYSDLNFGLLGKVIEKISDQPIDEVYQNHIIKPLGLNKTCFITDDCAVPAVWFKNKQIYRPKFLSTHGEQAVITTTDELMIFIKSFFMGSLFGMEVFDELSTYTKLQSMFPMRSGGGYWQIPLGGFANLFMGKGELLGHSGSTGSFAFYYPHKKLYFVGDLNQAAAPALPIRLVMRLAMKVK